MHILHCLSALLGGFAKNNYELCYQRTQIWCWYEFYYYSQWWKGHQKTVSSLDSTWLFPLLGSCYQASQDSEMCMKWQQKSLLLHRSLSVDMPQASRCTKPLKQRSMFYWFTLPYVFMASCQIIHTPWIASHFFCATKWDENWFNCHFLVNNILKEMEEKFNHFLKMNKNVITKI